MTDFLTSIANRNFGSAATIRPRLSSMFEPSRARATFTELESEAGLERRSVVRERAALDYHQRRDFPVRAPEKFMEDAIEPKIANSRDPLLPIHRLLFNSEELEQAAITPNIAANLPDPHPHWDEVRLKKDDTVARRNEVEEAAQHRGHTTAEIERHEENLIGGIREQSVTLVPRALPESALVGDRVLASGVPFQEPRPSETAPRKSLLAPQIPETLTMEMRDSIAAENQQRFSAARWNRGTRKATAATEPDVQVTIGRIEVRATVEAPPNRSTRVASPEMGLDEYLRRHRQRGGR